VLEMLTENKLIEVSDQVERKQNSWKLNIHGFNMFRLDKKEAH